MNPKIKYSSSNRVGHKPTEKELKYVSEVFAKKVQEYAKMPVEELKALKLGGTYRDAQQYVLKSIAHKQAVQANAK